MTPVNAYGNSYLFTKGGIQNHDIVLHEGAVLVSDIVEIPQCASSKYPLKHDDFENAVLFNESSETENIEKKPYSCVYIEDQLAIKYCPELDSEKCDITNTDESKDKVPEGSPSTATNKKNKKRKKRNKEHSTNEDASQSVYHMPGNKGAEFKADRASAERAPKHDVRLSKALSYVLRHGAQKMGFNIMSDGFVFIDDILRHDQFSSYTMEDIERVTANNEKKRFFIDYTDKQPKIRANQGHSLEVDIQMREISVPDQYTKVIHGTYLEAWESIRTQGLSRMTRNHIHFAAGLPGSQGVISGMRRSCQVIIELDLRKAMADGIKFFESANGVILTPGDHNGFLKPMYLKSAFERKTNKALHL